MSPHIKIGDGLIIKRVEFNSLRIGDVITYHQGNGLISHRIVTVNLASHAIVTKGDHNEFIDTAIPATVIVGRAVAIIPYLGKATSLLKTPFALLILVYLPSVTAILWEARSLQRSLIKPYRLPGRSFR